MDERLVGEILHSITNLSAKVEEEFRQIWRDVRDPKYDKNKDYITMMS